ncbi:hypothetical protein MMC13_007393 [Lambiella insularis]|nr:hypothetical protein [Lambiella insularis]
MGEPTPVERLAAEAEAGMGANAQTVDQSQQAVDTEYEKAINSDDRLSVRTDETAVDTEHGHSRKESGLPHPAPPENMAASAGQPRPQEKKERSKAKIVLLMLALCMAVFLAALDMTIITTALPTIAASYSASQADYTWIGSAYLLASAASTPSWGKVSDIFGRKPVLLIANVVFFVGSLICAVSINVNMLLAGRVIQGIGGGGLIILVNICISDLFSMRDRGMYFGLIGMTWALASALGPVLGGVFTQLVTWRWCFYINLPLDGAAFIILFIFLDIETPTTPLWDGLKAIDWLGSLTIVGGTVMVLFGLEFGGVSHPWNSAIVICLIVFGFITIGIFFLIEWKIAKYPVIPLRIFSKRSNVAALATCFFHGFVFISGSYYLPLYFQAVLGASPLLSGVYLFPFVLSLSFVSAGAGVYIRKTGQYLPPIWFGMFFMTLGFGLYINFPGEASWPRIIIFQIIAGVGVGPNFQSPLIALQSLVHPRDIATATATFGFTRSLATAISVVVGGVVFQNGMEKRLPDLLAALPPQLAHELAGGSAGANTAVVSALPASQREIAVTAYTQSLQTMWIFYTCIALVGLCASLAIGKNVLSKTHETTQTGLAAQEQARKEEKEEKAEKLRTANASRETVEKKEEV